jgi:hypothetical protein
MLIFSTGEPSSFRPTVDSIRMILAAVLSLFSEESKHH